MTRITMRRAVGAMLAATAFGVALALPSSTEGALSQASTPTPLTPVVLDLHVDQSTPTTFSGMWYGSGAIADSGGFVRTRFNLTGSLPHSPTVGAFQSELTLTSCKGTFVVQEELRFTLEGVTGTWQIVEGTGAYDRLSGHGTFRFISPTHFIDSGVVSKAA